MKKGYMRELDFFDYLKSMGVKEKKKYVEFTNFYFPEILEDFSKCDKFYLDFVDAALQDNIFLYKCFVKGKAKIDIAKEENMSETAIYSYFSRTKSLIKNKYSIYSKYNNYDFYKIRKYIEFGELFFEDLITDPNNLTTLYLDFVEKNIEHNQIISELLLKRTPIDKAPIELGMSKASFLNRLSKLKSRLRKKYDSIKIYKDSKLSEILMYVKFSEQYFPFFVGSEDIQDKDYLKFIDKIVEEDELFRLYFKENKTKDEIALILNVSKRSVEEALKRRKMKVMKLYDKIVLKTGRK